MHQTNVSSNLCDCMTARWLSALWPKSFVDFTLTIGSRDLIVNDVLCGGVVQPSTALDHCPAIPYIVLLALFGAPLLFAQRSIHIHSPYNTEGQPFYILIQTASNLAQWTRKHWNNSVHKVHRSCPTKSFFVNSTGRLYKVRNIGDVYSNFNSSVWQLSYVQCIVQVPSCRRINRKHTMAAIVSSPTAHFLRRFPAHFTFRGSTGALKESPRLYSQIYFSQHRRRKLSMIHTVLNE
mmetsp:Transcript_8640/g.19388  ORF Transcript_8640/g.19388 Transcript_8640/m.19388 type:complete len:236 (+) Transcript_8640:990-1697(+)